MPPFEKTMTFRSLTLAILAAPLLAPVFARAQVSAPGSYSSEAARITNATISRFYSAPSAIWRPQVPDTESIDTQGYTFWPSLIAWQAVIEGAKVDPAVWKPRIATYFDTLEQYYHPTLKAYCAWRYFNGNNDQYYDDNAWAVIACIEAYEVTNEARYLNRAIEIMNNFEYGGWDNTGNPGGIRWGTYPVDDRNDRTTSATAGAALAALSLAPYYNTAFNQSWGKSVLDWLHGHLKSTNSELICDGLAYPNYTVMPTLWTYSTGVPIRAALKYYSLSGDTSYRDWARRMGDACLDRGLQPLYDGAVTDPNKRHWYDAGFFVHYLVDGLRLLSLATSDPKYMAEAKRNADFTYSLMRDPSDGLYWRNCRLWTINADRTNAFYTLTGQNWPALTPDASERSQAPSALSLPVGQRPMTKTLLGNAGAARLFWLVAH